jgi:hypothetical protein
MALWSKGLMLSHDRKFPDHHRGEITETYGVIDMGIACRQRDGLELIKRRDEEGGEGKREGEEGGEEGVGRTKQDRQELTRN